MWLDEEVVLGHAVNASPCRFVDLIPEAESPRSIFFIKPPERILGASVFVMSFLTVFCAKLAFADLPPPVPGAPPVSSSTQQSSASTAANVTIAPSSEGLSSIKDFFDNSNYGNLTTPASGVQSVEISP